MSVRRVSALHSGPHSNVAYSTRSIRSWACSGNSRAEPRPAGPDDVVGLEPPSVDQRRVAVRSRLAADERRAALGRQRDQRFDGAPRAQRAGLRLVDRELDAGGIEAGEEGRRLARIEPRDRYPELAQHALAVRLPAVRRGARARARPTRSAAPSPDSPSISRQSSRARRAMRACQSSAPWTQRRIAAVSARGRARPSRLVTLDERDLPAVGRRADARGSRRRSRRRR